MKRHYTQLCKLTKFARAGCGMRLLFIGAHRALNATLNRLPDSDICFEYDGSVWIYSIHLSRVISAFLQFRDDGRTSGVERMRQTTR